MLGEGYFSEISKPHLFFTPYCLFRDVAFPPSRERIQVLWMRTLFRLLLFLVLYLRFQQQIPYFVKIVGENSKSNVTLIGRVAFIRTAVESGDVPNN